VIKSTNRLKTKRKLLLFALLLPLGTRIVMTCRNRPREEGLTRQTAEVCAMQRIFSSRLKDDLAASFHAELQKNHIINIPVLAEQIWKRNEQENVALEDISEWLMHYAKSANAAMVFERATLDA
jgi:hypothetical protein